MIKITLLSLIFLIKQFCIYAKKEYHKDSFKIVENKQKKRLISITLLYLNRCDCNMSVF